MSQNFQDETSKTLSGVVYYDDDRGTPNGWIVDHSFDKYTQNPKTGFYSKVYYNPTSNSVAIAIRGTTITDLQDVRNDIQMARGRIPAQFYDADKLYYYVQKKYRNSNIEFTGTSLAASLGQLMSKHTGRPSTGFEPYGTGDIIKNHPELFNKNADITNYGREGDWIFGANSDKQPGKTYVLPALEQRTDLKFLRGPFSKNLYRNLELARMAKSGFWESHKLENYPSLDKAKLSNLPTSTPAFHAKVAQNNNQYKRNNIGTSLIGHSTPAVAAKVMRPNTSANSGLRTTLLLPPPPIMMLDPILAANNNSQSNQLITNYISGASNPNLADAGNAVSSARTQSSNNNNSSSNSGGGFNWGTFGINLLCTFLPSDTGGYVWGSATGGDTGFGTNNGSGYGYSYYSSGSGNTSGGHGDSGWGNWRDLFRRDNPPRYINSVHAEIHYSDTQSK